MDLGPSTDCTHTDNSTHLSSKYLRKLNFRQTAHMNELDESTGVRNVTKKAAAIELNATDAEQQTSTQGEDATHSATSPASVAAGSEKLPSVESSSSMQQDASTPSVTQDAAKPLNIPSSSADSGSSGSPTVPSILPLTLSTSTNSLEMTSLPGSSSTPLTPEGPSEITTLVSSSSVASFPLTAEELDCAKDLVLDLLGWGVAPEYLIESGVSAQAIFRIFTDLNLRLPANCVLSDEIKASLWS